MPFVFIHLRTLLHSPRTQLLCFQSIPHSLRKTPGGWGTSLAEWVAPGKTRNLSRAYILTSVLPLLPETATPFPQRWGLLRKGRAVFRREDRLDCFVVNENYARAIICQVEAAAGLPARSASFRAYPVHLVSPCSPTARRRAKRPVPAAGYSSACRSYRPSADRCACSSPRSANHWSTNARIRW